MRSDNNESKVEAEATVACETGFPPITTARKNTSLMAGIKHDGLAIYGLVGKFLKLV